MSRTVNRARKDAVEINRLHAEIEEATRTTVKKAIRIGQLLSKAKARMPHGMWLPWLEDNVVFDVRTAQRYMLVYKRRDEFKYDTMSYLAEVHQLLAEPKEADEQQPRDGDFHDDPGWKLAKIVELKLRAAPDGEIMEALGLHEDDDGDEWSFNALLEKAIVEVVARRQSIEQRYGEMEGRESDDEDD